MNRWSFKEVLSIILSVIFILGSVSIIAAVYIYFSPLPTTEQINKAYNDRIEWCFKQGGKAKFNYRNEYQGCEVQK